MTGYEDSKTPFWFAVQIVFFTFNAVFQITMVTLLIMAISKMRESAKRQSKEPPSFFVVRLNVAVAVLSMIGFIFVFVPSIVLKVMEGFDMIDKNTERFYTDCSQIIAFTCICSADSLLIYIFWHYGIGIEKKLAQLERREFLRLER